MAEDNNNIVNSTADDEEKKKAKNSGKKPNISQNIIKFIASHIVVIGYIAMALLIIIFIIGILQILITMPGLIIGKIKEIMTNFFGKIAEEFNGDSVSYTIDEEDEINLIEHIRTMGYNIEGFGFGEVSYVKDGDGNATKEIESVHDGDEKLGVRGYARSYLISSAATYAPAVWSWKGFFGNLFSDEATQDASKGMIRITENGRDIDDKLLASHRSSYDIRIIAEKRAIKVTDGGFGPTYYFNMSDWSSKYGKPMELFLALHLATMMPDLTYDLATSDAFNTKVTIDFQTVKRTYKIEYTTLDGHTYTQDDILKDYIRIATGSSTNATEDELYDEASDALDSSSKIEAKYWSLSNTSLRELEVFYDDEERHGTKSRVEAMVRFVLDGNKEKTMLWPRITDVKKHWYYNDIVFNYGRAKYAKKDIMYSPEDGFNELSSLSGRLVMKTTMTSKEGFFYQLAEPERDGPNEAIIALFKGNNPNYPDFKGKYYRYDGDPERAQMINNARAKENGGGQYLFKGNTYNTVPVTVSKEPVVFYDVDNKNSYKNAYTAFAMLEKTHSEEAEVSYRCLKELMVKLDYFTEDELKDPITQVLKWVLPDNRKKTNISKNPNLYGLSTIGNLSSHRIIAPGDGTVIEIEDNTLTMEFGKLNPQIVSTLKKKYHLDEESNSNNIQLDYIDEDAIVGLQMVIVGISPTVSKGQTVNVDQYLGTPVEGDGNVQVYFKYADGSIVDNVETYMNIYDENF